VRGNRRLHWACDCGSADAGLDAAPSDGSPADSGADITPYLKNCPQVSGTASMVEIPSQGGGSFCIDTREVTAAEFEPYRFGGTKAYPANCPLFVNSSCKGSTPNAVPNTGALPADCLGWCMAFSFCAQVGKRLCTSGEFRRTCEGTRGDLPWGGDFAQTSKACFGLSPLPPAGSTACHTTELPYGFANELANGLYEWTNDVPVPNANTKGQVSGGATEATYQSGSPICEFLNSASDVATSSDYPGYKHTGFRCCANAK
jgi:formylglycine-generating enzyme required for sulfatase activity